MFSNEFLLVLKHLADHEIGEEFIWRKIEGQRKVKAVQMLNLGVGYVPECRLITVLVDNGPDVGMFLHRHQPELRDAWRSVHVAGIPFPRDDPVAFLEERFVFEPILLLELLNLLTQFRLQCPINSAELYLL